MSNNNGLEAVGAIKHMKKKGSLKIIIIGFLIGVALLIVGGVFFKDGEKGEESDVDRVPAYGSFSEYKECLRQEIEAVCLRISGVRGVCAVVFFDGAGESIYAENGSYGNGEKSEYVIIGSGSNAHALYLGESLPEIAGIGVVCDTGGNADLRNEIAALLAATYGLPLTRVYVSEGK